MDRNEILQSAGQSAQMAMEKGQAALADAASRVAPYVEQAGGVIGPMAADAAEKIRPALREAQIRSARAAAQGLAKVQPALDEALRQATPAADAAVKRIAPAVEDILYRIPPSIEAARGKLHDDLLPRLSDTLSTLADQPLGGEVLPALEAATIAVDAEIATPKKKHPWAKRLGVLALVGAVVGVACAALKKALEPPDAGWVTHTPADAYIADPTTDDMAAPDVIIGGEPIVVGVPPEAEKAGDANETAAPADAPYGPGSYVGDNPPAGYEVKGNARSMKYHLPGQAMYARTTAEVWFDSAESAERAGFSPVTH